MASRFGALGRGAAVVFLVLATASSARAEPTAAERETARQLMEQARDALDQKNWKGALEAFKAADAIMHVPSTGFQVGNAQMELGLLVEARDTFGRVMQLPQPADESAAFKRARTASTELYDQLARRIPSLRFDVRGAKGDVSVLVDDVALSPAVQKFPFKLNPGHHVVVARAGAANVREEVDVREGETKDVVLNMLAGTPAATPEPEPAATNGGAARTLTYVGFGVAGVGVAVGTVTGILMFSKKSSLDSECSADKQCPRNGDLDSAYTMATISTVSFIVAGVGAGVGVYGLLSGRRSAPASAARGAHVEPWAGLGSGGLRGSF